MNDLFALLDRIARVRRDAVNQSIKALSSSISQEDIRETTLRGEVQKISRVGFEGSLEYGKSFSARAETLQRKLLKEAEVSALKAAECRSSLASAELFLFTQEKRIEAIKQLALLNKQDEGEENE